MRASCARVLSGPSISTLAEIAPGRKGRGGFTTGRALLSKGPSHSLSVLADEAQWVAGVDGSGPLVEFDEGSDLH